MAVFSAGARTPAAAAAAAYCDFHTLVLRNYITEFGAFCSAATASSIGLGKPGNTPAATTSAAGQKHDNSDGAANGGIGTAWSVTAPTVPGNFMRRIGLPATIGAGVIWTFAPDKTIVVGITQDLGVIFWNFGGSAGSALDVYATWTE